MVNRTMQSSVEKISAIGRKMSVVLPADRVETAIQTKLRQLSKRVKIQGFRPGKVPMKIVEQQYRGSATNEVLGDLIQTSFQEALRKEEIVPAVQPDITPEPLKKGDDFTYVASFDVYPKFEKLDLVGVKVVKPESEVSEADVEKVIESMRVQQQTWEEVESECGDGDRVIIDFHGTIDGEEFEEGQAADVEMALGERQISEGFDAAIVGMRVGESTEVEVVLPEEWPEEVVGKKALFKIDLKVVSVAKVPEVDEEFIKGFGIESGDKGELLKEVQSNLEASLETQLSQSVRAKVFDALLENNNIEMPLKMVREEAGRIVEERKNQMLQQGIDAKLLDQILNVDFEVLRPEAEKRVAMALLLMEIIRKLELKPDTARVNARIEKMASSYRDSNEFIEYYQNDKESLLQVQSLILEEQVVDLLLQEADVEVEKIDASELLNIR